MLYLTRYCTWTAKLQACSAFVMQTCCTYILLLPDSVTVYIFCVNSSHCLILFFLVDFRHKHFVRVWFCSCVGILHIVFVTVWFCSYMYILPYRFYCMILFLCIWLAYTNFTVWFCTYSAIPFLLYDFVLMYMTCIYQFYCMILYIFCHTVFTVRFCSYVRTCSAHTVC